MGVCSRNATRNNVFERQNNETEEESKSNGDSD